MGKRLSGLIPHLLGLLALVSVLLPPLERSLAQVQDGATLTVLRGEVAVVRSDGSATQPAPSGTTVFVGDEIRTVGPSGALITFFSGTEIELGEATVLAVERVSKQGDRVEVSLKQVFGVTVSRIQSFSDPGSAYRIDAGGAVALVRGSELTVVGPECTSEGCFVAFVCLDCGPRTVLQCKAPVLLATPSGKGFRGYGVEVDPQTGLVGDCTEFRVDPRASPFTTAFEILTGMQQRNAQGGQSPGVTNLGNPAEEEDEEDEDNGDRTTTTSTTTRTTRTRTRTTRPPPTTSTTTTAPTTTTTKPTTTTTTTCGTTSTVFDFEPSTSTTGTTTETSTTTETQLTTRFTTTTTTETSTTTIFLDQLATGQLLAQQRPGRDRPSGNGDACDTTTVTGTTTILTDDTDTTTTTATSTRTTTIPTTRTETTTQTISSCTNTATELDPTTSTTTTGTTTETSTITDTEVTTTTRTTTITTTTTIFDNLLESGRGVFAQQRPGRRQRPSGGPPACATTTLSTTETEFEEATESTTLITTTTSTETSTITRTSTSTSFDFGTGTSAPDAPPPPERSIRSRP